MAGPIKNTERLVAQRFFALMEGKSSTAGAPSGGGEEACPFRVPPGVPGPPKSEGRGDSGRWRGNWFKHASSMGLELGLAFSKCVFVTWRHDSS